MLAINAFSRATGPHAHSLAHIRCCHHLRTRSFTATKRWTAAVALINAAEPAPLSKVLARLLKALPEKKVRQRDSYSCAESHAHARRGGTRSQAPTHSRRLPLLPSEQEAFSNAETEQLREAFGLGESDLELLLGVGAFIFEQAAYSITPPETLRTELLDAGLAEEAALACSTVWLGGAAECVQALKERSVLAPASLAGLDWQLRLGTAHSNGGRTPAGHAVLQLELEHQVPASSASATAGMHATRTPVQVQLDAEAMTGLLRKLDVIQGQMDRLS